MDSNVIFILDSGVETVAYKNLFKVCTNYENICKQELLTWVEQGTNLFYVHNASRQSSFLHAFPAHIMLDVIDILQHKFGFIPTMRHIKFRCHFKNVREPALYLSAIAVANSKYVGLLLDNISRDDLNIQEFSAAKICNRSHVQAVRKSVMRNFPENCSHVLYTFFYKFKTENSKTMETFKLSFVEAMTLKDIRRGENRDACIASVMFDTRKLFRELKIFKCTMASFIYLDDSTVLEDSEHVFRFLEAATHFDRPYPPLVNFERLNLTKPIINLESLPAARVQSPAIEDDLHEERVDPAIMTEPEPLMIEPKQLIMTEPEQSIIGVGLLVPRADQPASMAEAQPPSSPEESQNQISYLKSIIIKLDRKCKHLQKEKDEIKRKTSREVLDKLTASHNEIMQSQREKFDEIIYKTNQTHDLKIKSLSEYYDELLQGKQEKVDSYKVRCEDDGILRKENMDLKMNLAICKERLDNIQCYLLGETLPPPVPAKDIKLTIKDVSREQQSIKKENDNINETIRQHERQIADMKSLNDSLQKQLQIKETIINNMMFQVNYYKDVRSEEQKENKKLEVEYAELTKNMERMQARHTEQFKEYEKLLKRSRQEVDIHKREVAKLRHHYGNFPPSPAARRLLRVSNGLSNSTPDLTCTTQSTIIKPLPKSQIRQPPSEVGGSSVETIIIVRSPESEAASPAPSCQESIDSNKSDILSVMSSSVDTTNTIETIETSPSSVATASKSGAKSKASSKSKTKLQTALLKSQTITQKSNTQQSEAETQSISSSTSDKSCKTPGKAATCSTLQKNPKYKELAEETGSQDFTLGLSEAETQSTLSVMTSSTWPSSNTDSHSFNNMLSDIETVSTTSVITLSSGNTDETNKLRTPMASASETPSEKIILNNAYQFASTSSAMFNNQSASTSFAVSNNQSASTSSAVSNTYETRKLRTPAKSEAAKTPKGATSSKKKTTRTDNQSNYLPSDTESTSSTISSTYDTRKLRTPAKTPKDATPAKTDSLSSSNVNNSALSCLSSNTIETASCCGTSKTANKTSSNSEQPSEVEMENIEPRSESVSTKRPRGRPRKNTAPKK